MKDLDISNIESKPTVVLVSNQSEFDQLMQHLEREGYGWINGGEKPTQWRPSTFLLPYIINIYPDKKITWGLESNQTAIPFPEYAAKYIKPTGNTGKFKRDRKRVEKHKYDAVVFDLKMTQTALDNRNKDIEGWVKQNNELRAERDRLQSEIEALQLQITSDEQLCGKRVKNWEDNYVWATSQMRTLRDQRDTARFLAALFFLVCAGFAVGV